MNCIVALNTLKGFLGRHCGLLGEDAAFRHGCRYQVP